MHFGIPISVSDLDHVYPFSSASSLCSGFLRLYATSLSWISIFFDIKRNNFSFHFPLGL